MSLPEACSVNGKSDFLHLIPICTAYFTCRDSVYHALYVNDIMTSLLGKSGDELADSLTHNHSDLIHEEDKATVSLMIYKAMISGGNFHETARVQIKSGEFKWMEICLSSEPQTDGSCIICFVLMDVNMRMERQKKLDSTFTQLLGVMNNTPGGIVVLDTINNRKLVPSFVSQGMANLLGGTLEEIKAEFKEDPYATVHPDDREKTVRTVEDALRNLSGFQLSIRLRTVSGEYVWVSAKGTIDTVENQRVLYMVFVDSSTDTEYLHVQKQILDLFVRHQYEHICVIDAKHNSYHVLNAVESDVTFFAEKGSDYDGDAAKLVQKSIVPEEREHFAECIKINSLLTKLEESDSVEYYCTVFGKDGKQYEKKNWFMWLDKETKLIAFVNSDVTDEQRQSEESRNVLRASLRAAEQANAAKSEFLARMSHDIRTPLNAIIGYIEMSMEDTTLSSKVRDHLSKADASSKFLLSLINDILNMSRIESGKLALKETDFELSGFMNSISSIVSSQCASKQIQYTCVITDGTNHVYRGDCLKLQQVLLNIIGNSVKFTSEEGQITITVTELPRGKSSIVRFEVKDSGCGISPEFLPHLFEPFTQERRALDSEIKGTGLGLAICKSLVSMMGGAINVESEVGVGSLFTIEVPLGVEAQSEDEKQKSTEKKKKQTSTAEGMDSVSDADVHDFKGKHILLAEDNELNVEIAKHVLEKANLVIDVAENGKVACEKFAASQEGFYSVILMDIRMPVMDGLTAAQSIRDMKRSDNAIPIIAMSANAFEEDVREALNCGMNAYTIKPIDVPQLYATLHQFIN